MTDQTDDGDKPSREELEQRVAQLEQTVSQMLPSRRDALKLGGTALAAGALGSAATGSASAGTQSVGTVGTQSDPVDIEAEDVTADAITTDDAVIGTLEADGAVINGEYHFASEHDGGDADARLDNALSAATNGDRIYLENATYTQDISVNTADVFLQGVSRGTRFDGATIDIGEGQVRIENITLSSATIEAGFQNIIHDISGGTIIIDFPQCHISVINDSSITLNSDENVVDQTIRATITDNGNNNTIGDTA